MGDDARANKRQHMRVGNRGVWRLYKRIYFFFNFRGKFGKVLKCVHRSNGQTFAAKFVLCSTREDRRNVEREVGNKDISVIK